MKLKYLVVLIVLGTIGVITFQISWLKNSYQISRDKLIIDANQLFDEAVIRHKELVTDSVRMLLKQGIRSTADFDFGIIEVLENHRVDVGYRCKGKTTTGWISFKVTFSEAKEMCKNPFPFLLQKINTGDLDQLESIYSTLIGVGNYPEESEKNKLQKKLMVSFYFHQDTTTMNKIVRQMLSRKKMDFEVHTYYFHDLEDIYLQKLSKINIDPNRKVAIIATEVSLSKTRKTLNSRLDSLNGYVQLLNRQNDDVIVAKPWLHDASAITMNQVPIILLTLKVPNVYVLNLMLYSIIGSATLLLLIGFCLTYMFYTIIKQKKLADIKDDFISNVSHELKTPVATTLAAIQGMQYFDVLLNKEKTEQYLATAANEMQRLSAMIDTILKTAIFESGSFVIRPAPFNLKAMLVELIAAQQHYAMEQLSIELKYSANEEIIADQIHLRNVFTNLIDNAIKYNSDKVMLQLSVNQRDKGIKIEIRDNGIGIPSAYQKSIFDKFFRVPTPNDHRVKGYGLGLSYVKKIIEKHKGTIRLVESSSAGSTFEIYLPQ